ncbi:O-antigen ligase family protein [Patescibacteria group bacterium]|nr:O-antigen ligase family protein [Patescibacteria group bacterium]MBU1721350.1 O-antigen ligase family protein [Patescibacteria group bacterium]MBU1901558.1 O-antigen ligase family protein [Patescibacteria group bacterium]
MNILLLTIIFISFAYITWYRFTWGIFLFLLLLPSYLLRFSIGPLPTTILEGFFVLLVFFWIINQWQKTTIKQTIHFLWNTHHTLIIASILLFAGASIGTLISLDTQAAAGLWKAFFVEPMLFALILIDQFRNKPKKYIQTYIFTPLLLIALTTAMLAVYQHFTGWMVPWDFWENRNTFRITGWYGFPNGVGLFLPPMIPLALYILHDTWKNKQNRSWWMIILALAYIPFGLLGIIYAKSTGGLVGVAGAIAALLFLYKKTRIPMIILGIGSILAVYSLAPTNPIRQELFFQDRSGQMRLDMWAETTELIITHPITGVGLASYQTAIYPYRIDKWIEVFHHPHNMFFTMWVNVGIIGLIGWLWILVWYIHTAWKHKNTLEAQYLFAIIATFTIMGLVDSPYIKNDMAMLYWIFPAILAILPATQNSPNE